MPFARVLFLLSSIPHVITALHVLIVGGSGRVGASTARWLHTLSNAGQTNLSSLTVGSRHRHSFEAAVQAEILPAHVDFVVLDVDGNESVLRSALQQWQQRCHSDQFLVVHTAGPFQGRRSPTLLAACIDSGIPYVDVCDEWELAEISKQHWHAKAKLANVPAVVCCGIWPGVSALMAAEGVAHLMSRTNSIKDNQNDSDNCRVKISSIDYSFFTAGTGNAGPTIVSATFLLLATPVISFLNGRKLSKEPWTEMKQVDFGRGVGTKPVWLLDNPDVPTTALYLKNSEQQPHVENVSSRFGTDPLPWNYLFGALKALPKALLSNRQAMQNFSQFSGPIIRIVDRLVGATNAMRVDITAQFANGEEEMLTLRMAHKDLEQCVGLATAAFALEVANSARIVQNREGEVTAPPGVWFPVELTKEARKTILEIVKEGAFVYELC